jgi:hypothetical protein
MACSRFALGSLCFGFFLVANPAYFVSCSSTENTEDGGFQYDEADMLEVVEQLNAAPHLDIESPSELSGYQLEFELEQSSQGSSDTGAQLAPTAGWIESAHACDQRTFVKAAAACINISTLPLEGTVRLKSGESVVRTFEVTGAMHVMSNLLTEAEFELSFEDALLYVSWSDEGGGTFRGVEVWSESGLSPLGSGLGGAGGGR